MALFKKGQAVRVDLGFGDSFQGKVVRTEMVSVLVEWQSTEGTRRTWVHQCICRPDPDSR